MQQDQARMFVSAVFACPADVAEQVTRHACLRSFARTAIILRQSDWRCTPISGHDG